MGQGDIEESQVSRTRDISRGVLLNSGGEYQRDDGVKELRLSLIPEQIEGVRSEMIETRSEMIETLKKDIIDEIEKEDDCELLVEIRGKLKKEKKEEAEENSELLGTLPKIRDYKEISCVKDYLLLDDKPEKKVLSVLELELEEVKRILGDEVSSYYKLDYLTRPELDALRESLTSLYKPDGCLKEDSKDKLLDLIGEYCKPVKSLNDDFVYAQLNLRGQELLRNYRSHERKDIKEIAQPEKISVEEILDMDKKEESWELEYKASLFWDLEKKEKNKELTLSVMQEIAAFMNTRGGRILIGVGDDGEVKGLDEDIRSLKRENEDQYQLQFFQNFGNMIGMEFAKNIRFEIKEVKGKKVCDIHVVASKKPVILKNNKGEQSFYIRVGNSKQPLLISKMLDYVDDHFDKFETEDIQELLSLLVQHMNKQNEDHQNFIKKISKNLKVGKETKEPEKIFLTEYTLFKASKYRFDNERQNLLDRVEDFKNFSANNDGLENDESGALKEDIEKIVESLEEKNTVKLREELDNRTKAYLKSIRSKSTYTT